MHDRVRHDGDSEGGFTLVELLVVVLIVGVLAAIALPFLTRQRYKGQDASAKTDIGNAVVQMESCFAENGTYVPCDETMLTGVGLGNVFTYGYHDATGYYLETTSKSTTHFGVTHYSTGNVTKCYYRRAGGGCKVDDGPW